MWIHDRPCHLCSNGIKPEMKGRIDDSEWYLLFKKSTVGDDPSVYYPNQTISTRNLETKLSHSLLQEFSEEIKVSKQLREFRNSIVHHASCKFNSDDFQQKWSEIETILVHLSQIYGEEAQVRQNMYILRSMESQPNIDSLLQDMAMDIELESKLNDVRMVINYRTEPRFTTEDLQEYVDTIAYETVNQRRVVYERRSAKEIQSKCFQIKGQRKGVTFQLDKSSVIFKPENPPVSTVEYSSTFNTETPPSEEIIYTRVPDNVKFD
ncbi:uncharacterized protein LOC143053745 [Mytilus galloprovincialis]|uniref:uncharacterized protein LOC143053745 n=1 Tax=Mytilus galloprovincialis TaxID=29158 RepID=UPI003F7C891B